MAILSRSGLFRSPKLDSRIRSANTQGSEKVLGYFFGPCLVYMAYCAIAGTYLTQFYTDVLGITGVFLTMMPVFSKIFDAVTNISFLIGGIKCVRLYRARIHRADHHPARCDEGIFQLVLCGCSDDRLSYRRTADAAL